MSTVLKQTLKGMIVGYRPEIEAVLDEGKKYVSLYDSHYGLIFDEIGDVIFVNWASDKNSWGARKRTISIDSLEVYPKKWTKDKYLANTVEEYKDWFEKETERIIKEAEEKT